MLCKAITYGFEPPMFLNRSEESEPRARRSAGIPGLRSDFNKFLYAPINELDDEAPFSVLSALARQNVDPWEEAAALTRLSRESAILRLTTLISSMTTGPSAPAATAARLIALLPSFRRFDLPSDDKSASDAARDLTPIIIYVIVGAMIIASAIVGS